MVQDKAKIVRLVYGVVFALFSVTVAVLLILQVSDIYFNGGESPYTVETIKQHFNAISPVIYVWLALILGGFIIFEVFPMKEKGGKVDAYYTFTCLEKKLESMGLVNTDEAKQYEKQRLISVIVKFACGIAIGICIAFSLAFLLDDSNFKNQNQNLEVAKASLYLLPYVAVSFVLPIGVVIFENIFVKKELAVVKKLVKEGKTEPTSKKQIIIFKEKVAKIFNSRQTVFGLRLTVAVVGTVLLIYGLATGGSAGVLAKAITICRQCIGLG